jgi:hypothetical protein
MTRLLFYAWLALTCAGYATVSNASGVGYPFTFEVRIPKTANPDISATRVVFVAHHEKNVVYWRFGKQREEAGFLVFQKEFLLFSEDKPQRGLIIRALPAASQVFRLSIPETPKPQDWSQWQRPSYVEAGDAVETFFLPDGQAPDRSTNVPPVCFEVRYKIESKRIE